MSRLIFAAVTSLSIINSAAAQRVAGRDLLDFPIGLLAEAPPLSMQIAGGLWNPAASALPPSTRASFGVAGLTTPQQQGVVLQMISGAYRLRPELTASFSITEASVTDILHTETDPQSLGSEIPYGTTVFSAAAARRRGNVSLGLAARYRSGSVDVDHASVFALDGGILVDSIAGTPVRIALSTFLLSPWESREESTYMVAADAPVYRRDSTFVVRGGYSFAKTDGRGSESYFFGTSSYRQVDLSAGLSQSSIYGGLYRRWRLGCGLRHASYHVAIGREDGAAGFGGSFQFLLTRALP